MGVYALGYQFTHLTKDRDCLGKDDRLESLAGLLLGVDPLGMASRARDEREEEELMALLRDAEDAVGRSTGRREGSRSKALEVTKR